MRKIRRRLKRIMICAGAVRNCDIALKLLSHSRTEDTAERRAKLQSRRKRFEGILVGLLERWTERKMSFKWRDAMDAAIARTEESFGRAAIEKTAQQTLSPMAKHFLQIGNVAVNPKASPEELHQFRIAAKKFRYTLELFVPLYGPTLNRGMERIKRVQTLLGDINDCATARELVSGDRGDGRADAWLEKRELHWMEEFRRYWSDEFGGRENVHGWIAYLRHLTRKPRSITKRAGRGWPGSGTARRGLRAVGVMAVPSLWRHVWPSWPDTTWVQRGTHSEPTFT
jgi:CHAD domain-containing protein